MSTLNPNILLSQKPLPSPIQTYGAVQQLKNAQGQNQLLTQQTQAAQEENQMRSIQMGQMLALNRAYQGALATGPDGAPTIDTDKLANAITQSGYGSALPGVMKSVTDYKTALTKLKQTQGNVAVQEADAGGAFAAAVKQANNDPHLFLTLAGHALQAGQVEQGQIAPLLGQVQQSLRQDPSGNTARVLVGRITDALIASSAKQRQLGAQETIANARQTAANTASAKFNVEKQGLAANSQQQVRSAAGQFLAGSKSDADYQERLQQVTQKYGFDVADFFRSEQPQWKNAGTGMSILQMAMPSTQQVSAAEAQSSLAERQRHDQATEANSARAEIGAGVEMTPQALDIAAKMYVQTGVLPSLGFGKAGAAAREKVLNRAAELFPNADIAGNKIDWENRRTTLQRFTTGVQGQQINAMNTAIGHLDQLGGAIANLGNGDVRAVNAAKNWLATEFGAAKVTNFDTLKVAVSGELASVLKKSGATDREIEDVQSTIASKNSPAQLSGYIRTQIPILGSKLGSLNYQYHQAMGASDPFSALSPDSKAILQKYGFNPAHPTLTQPGANASGASVRTGQIVTLRSGKRVAVTKVYPDGTFDAK